MLLYGYEAFQSSLGVGTHFPESSISRISTLEITTAARECKPVN